MSIIINPLQDTNLTFSRDKQDRYAMDVIFKKKEHGYFLDVGASDGITENNTYLMEKYYNWRGICFECDPRNIDKLCKNRSCSIVDSPVCDSTGQLVKFEMHQMEHLSGIAGFQSYRSMFSRSAVQTTVTLCDCLSYFNAPKDIDYMSLDTEGTEYLILSTFKFNEYKIGYIALEHNFQEPKRENIKKILEQNGYVYNRSIVCDDDYIHSSLLNKLK